MYADHSDLHFKISLLKKAERTLTLGVKIGLTESCLARRQHCSEDGPAGRARCSWGSPVRGDEIVSIGDREVGRMTRVECVKTLRGAIDQTLSLLFSIHSS